MSDAGAGEGEGMTEAEWLACDDPGKMLETLRIGADDRKLKLFSVACCRRIWHLLSNERSREAVDVLERCAEGRADDAELEAAAQEANRAAQGSGPSDNPYAGWAVANAVGGGQVDEVDERPERPTLAAAKDTAFAAAWAVGHHSHPDDSGDAWHAATKAHEAAECDLLRCVFGNPFRPPSIDPAVLTSTVCSLAQAAYDERVLPSGELNVARLAVLADALEDAGCTDDTILSHLRSRSPHVRGCWAVDLILGKE